MGTILKIVLTNQKKIEFNILGDEFFINSDKATSVALVVNEILQNAVEHAFVSRKEGRIDVVIEKGEEYSKIKISDDGVGMNESSNKNNMGYLIINSLVKDKLKGSITIESELDLGTTVEFNFKN